MFWKRKPQEGVVRVFEIREGRASVYIEAPPEKVWESLSNISDYPRWVRWFKVMVPDGQPRLERPGDYFDYETSLLGVKFTGRMVSVERIPPQRSAFVLLSPYRAGGEYLLEPMLSGTRVHYTIWSEIPTSYMGKLVDSALLASQAQDKMTDHLNRLKAYVEGAPYP